MMKSCAAHPGEIADAFAQVQARNGTPRGLRDEVQGCPNRRPCPPGPPAGANPDRRSGPSTVGDTSTPLPFSSGTGKSHAIRRFPRTCRGCSTSRGRDGWQSPCRRRRGFCRRTDRPRSRRCARGCIPVRPPDRKAVAVPLDGGHRGGKHNVRAVHGGSELQCSASPPGVHDAGGRRVQRAGRPPTD